MEISELRIRCLLLAVRPRFILTSPGRELDSSGVAVGENKI